MEEFKLSSSDDKRSIEKQSNLGSQFEVGDELVSSSSEDTEHLQKGGSCSLPKKCLRKNQKVSSLHTECF
jgi:hypothetical protein